MKIKTTHGDSYFGRTNNVEREEDIRLHWCKRMKPMGDYGANGGGVLTEVERELASVACTRSASRNIYW